MIEFERFSLSNGLRFVVHHDPTASMAVMNVLYDVGARDEAPERTGFAHLFEHLMFGGSINIPNYDEPLQMAGGENNAYTTNDITNYYIQLPKENLETAFWLESDRMAALAFTPNSLEVQRRVVCEEYKEHYINKPYGDAWMHLRELAYTHHPYRWMTIGKKLEHIEQATLQQVRDFFYQHYTPENAVVSVAGNIGLEEVRSLAHKWFGDIPKGTKYRRDIAQEPVQTEARKSVVHGAVPHARIYKAYHIAGRLQQQYYLADILSDILGSGRTARLYNALVKEQQLFSDISAYQTGSVDPGLLVIQGTVMAGVDIAAADAAIEQQLHNLCSQSIDMAELTRVKNKIESMIVFEDMNLMARANNLAFFELLGDAGLMNEELKAYQAVTPNELQQQAALIFARENGSTLWYLPE